MPEVFVKIDGKKFYGCTAATINLSMDAIAHAFSISGPRQYTADFEQAFSPFGYKRAQIYIDDQLMITGTLEKTAVALSASETTYNVQGRSLAGVLADSSLADEGYQWRNLDMMQIAQLVCRKHGITVEQSVGVMPKMAVIDGIVGETRLEFLQRLASSNGYLLKSQANGNLLITIAPNLSRNYGSLVEGDAPIISASGDYDGTKRHSYVRVIAQQSGSSRIEKVASDGEITIYRPRVIVGTEADADKAQSQADNERNLYISDSIGIQVTVSGWYASPGQLWAPEGTVDVRLPSIFLAKSTRYLITDVTYTYDAGGYKTTLKLVIPALYARKIPTRGYPWR